MKMFRYINAATIVAFLSLSSCDHFEEMNVSPNLPSEVATPGLLSSAQASIAGSFATGGFGFVGSQYTQQISQVEYPGFSNYDESGASSFGGLYAGPLINLDEMIKLCSDAEMTESLAKYGNVQNQLAVARIMKAWAYQNITDIWGDVPYSQALQGENGLFLPSYDTQEVIYNDLLKELDEASNALDASAQPRLQGDMFFNGDISMWKKFANSLKLRIALRLSEVNDSKANELINDNSFADVLSSSDDIVQLFHLESEAESNPLYYTNITANGGDEFMISEGMVDLLKSTNDPRLLVYADTTASKTDDGGYFGFPYGLSESEVDSYSASSYSQIGSYFLAQEAPSVIMTAAEVEFIRAEAAARGYISGGTATASEAYNNAIRLSMEQVGVDSEMIDDYLAQPEVQFDQNMWRQQIGEQKWVALFMQGTEAWSEWRRLDYPNLSPSPNAVISSIPRRRAYGSSEYASNSTNVEAAASRINGGDSYTSRVWWDK
ncbi:SusD/RagB family nutrient-binding outer membrane lipoprotein [Limibacter armeniacum]|uniref:SusD/RagB family nutrient-binding outer membrane lipoprotein n=1 Tax=Limibacter armeniacum TaxID=466084 RepID=UPI002FE62AFC